MTGLAEADALCPGDERALAEAVAHAPGPLRIVGGGTRPVGRPVAGQALSTRRLSGIRLYEPGALTLVAGAGTPLAEIEAALAAEGQRLPFEPMDYRALLGTDGAPTIGGVVATNASGPARVQLGACRDSLIGVRFVDGTGAAVANGGRVMKNVTGYDLVKLMAGSRGTLGVLTEVAFKLLPRPEARAVLLCEGLDDAAAVAALTAALRSPFEVSGAAHLQCGPDGAPVTMIRLEGFSASVTDRAARLRTLLAAFGGFEVEDDADRSARCWVWVRDVRGLAARDGDVWHLSVTPTHAPGLVARLAQAEVQYDWGGGRVWLRVPACTDLRAALGPFTGQATLVRATPETRTRLPVFQPEPPGVARLSAGLRARFDPRGILNPGLMG